MFQVMNDAKWIFKNGNEHWGFIKFTQLLAYLLKFSFPRGNMLRGLVILVVLG